MQAYEHIMVAMLNLLKSKKNKLTVEEMLNLTKQYGAYFTYPDSIRALVKSSTGSAFRQPSHASEGAWMQYIFGEELKKSDKYPLNKMYIPEGLELKAFDGPTDLALVLKHNPKLLDTMEGKAIYEHLKQDLLAGLMFQNCISTCYIDEKDINLENEENYSLYGVSVKMGFAKLKQTGKIISIIKYREIVSLQQKLTTLELFKKLKIVYPTITFEQIREAVFESYNKNYSRAMMNAKQYVVPSQEEQKKILHALNTNDYTYYEKIKKKLVEENAFKEIGEIDRKVSELISQVTDCNFNILV